MFKEYKYLKVAFFPKNWFNTIMRRTTKAAILVVPFCSRSLSYTQRPATALLSELHWLPVTSRITFKLACLTYKLLTTGRPAYLLTLLHQYTPTRTLRLTNQLFLEVPRFSTEFGKRSFKVKSSQVKYPLMNPCQSHRFYKKIYTVYEARHIEIT